MWGFNTLVTCGWGNVRDLSLILSLVLLTMEWQQQSGNGDKLMVPFSDIPNHRREVTVICPLHVLSSV